jgi:cysteine desulfurase
VSRSRAYLDHNATTPLHPAAKAAMWAALEQVGNASSVHAEGRAARAMIESARSDVAQLVGAHPKSTVFTSGGTEALNLALTPFIETKGSTKPFDVLLVAAGEHACVRSGHRFPREKVEDIALTSSGTIDLSALHAVLEKHDGQRVMLALQAANNETGTVQPVAEAAALVHAAGGLLVCDAVQAAAKTTCDIATLGADILVLSAHKFGGPKGAGALCMATEDLHIGAPLLSGGGQERGLRAGTENVAAIAGFGAAAAVARQSHDEAHLGALRDQLEAEVVRLAGDAVFFGCGASRLPNTSCFALEGLEAQVLLMLLDIEGVAVSSGSACSSGKVKPSHVLAAMGVPKDVARGAIRVSLGWNSQVEDVELFSRAFEKAVGTVRMRRLAQRQHVKSAA